MNFDAILKKAPTLKQQIDELEAKLKRLKDVSHDDRIYDIRDLILKERAHLIKPVEEQLKTLYATRDAKRKGPPKRWPDGCPAEVIKVCEAYWISTTNAHNFRIHMWNNKGIVTSYPGGSAYNRFRGSEYYEPGYFIIANDIEKVRHHTHLNLFNVKPSKIEMLDALNKL